MAKKYVIEGVTFEETGDPLQDSYFYDRTLGQYQMVLGTLTPGSTEYEKNKKIIAGITKRKGELDTVLKNKGAKAKKDKIIKEATDNLKKYEAQAKYAADSQDVKGYEEAVAAANVARETIVQAGGTPPPVPNITPPSTSKVVVTNPQAKDSSGNPVDNGVLADDKFSEFTYNNDGTVTNQKGEPGVFVMETDAAGNTTPKFYTSKAGGRDAFLKEYAKTGKLEDLKSQLLASGYIKKSQLTDGTWVTGIDDMLVAYTVKTVSDTKYNASQEPLGMTAFLGLKKTGGSGAGGGTSKYQVVTTRGDAKKILNTYLMDLVGRNSTPEEEEEFYNDLHKAEGKAVQTSAGGVVTGRVFTEDERLLLAAKVARKSLKGTDVGEILKSTNGSQVAIDIASLQKTAASYGVPMTPAEALKYVAAGLGQTDFLKKQDERLKLIAKQLYPTLVPHIDAGGTVKDIADVYGLSKSTKLGTIVTDSTYDKDVMDAVTKGESVSEFERRMQGKEEWRYTEEAHKVANDFASTILKSFGFGG
jgi:hypothetical protein